MNDLMNQSVSEYQSRVSKRGYSTVKIDYVPKSERSHQDQCVLLSITPNQTDTDKKLIQLGSPALTEGLLGFLTVNYFQSIGSLG